MSYVITSPCLGEQYAQCVDVCPVDCIYPGDHHGKAFMVIDPKLCIDCHACLAVCPVNAIIASPHENPEYAQLNERLAPLFKNNPAVPVRPPNDPPKNP